MLAMASPEATPEWQRLLSAPRHANAALPRAAIPEEPGVYAWFQDDECVYVGKASNLRDRLGAHRRTSLDLSRSTLRASVAVQELGVTRSHARSRPSLMTPAQIEAVNSWFQRASVAWLCCQTVGAAETLETRLRMAWMPPLNLA